MKFFSSFQLVLISEYLSGVYETGLRFPQLILQLISVNCFEIYFVYWAGGNANGGLAVNETGP
jgi:hypothetical protein